MSTEHRDTEARDLRSADATQTTAAKRSGLLKFGCGVLLLAPLPIAGITLLVRSAVVLSRGTAQPMDTVGLAILGATLVVVGIPILYMWIRRRSAIYHEALGRSRHPDSPWMWRKEWSGGSIASTTSDDAGAACGMALAYNLAAIPGCAALLLHATSDDWPQRLLLAELLLSAGAYLLVRAVIVLRRSWRFGSTTLKMASFPATIGGGIHGLAYTRAPFDAPRGITARISCIRRTTTRIGSENRVWIDMLWSRECRVFSRIEGPDGTLAIPVSIPIDDACCPTSDEDPKCIVRWQLELEADLDGVDYRARFDVPVFRTDSVQALFAMPEAPVSDAHGAEDPLPPPDPEQLLAERGITLVSDRTDPGILTINVGPMRNPSLAWLIGGITFALAGCAAGLLTTRYAGAALLMSPIVLLLLRLTLVAIFRRSTVTIDSKGVTVHRFFLGGTRTKRVELADIKGMRQQWGMHLGEAMWWYEIRVDTHSRRSTFVAVGLVNSVEACEYLAERMRTAWAYWTGKVSD